jgi:hypothetical protein
MKLNGHTSHVEFGLNVQKVKLINYPVDKKILSMTKGLEKRISIGS